MLMGCRSFTAAGLAYADGDIGYPDDVDCYLAHPVDFKVFKVALQQH